ncbi:E3 ubiquitin-protein ligase ubr1 [Coemansia sp. Benny D115]|nr:E3 ubiquitin-protein ligase ubr1 [Coemansia sp. Benny D115]
MSAKQETGAHTASKSMTPEVEEALGRAEDGSMPSESFLNEPYSIELYNYLRGTPKEHSYLLTPAARKDILNRVSWYLLSKDDRLAELVPLDERTGGAPREELQDELEVPIEYTEVRRGQPCGHVFKRGEGVYRCKSCSIDDTCVLCTRCFQATDHTGHDTSFSVNSGTGGCCDCGDPEAWKIPLRCRHHNSFEELEEVGLEPIISSAGAPFVPGYNNSECPASVKRSIELTIAVVLEFILETFATSPVELKQSFDEASIMEDAMNAGMAIGDHEPQTKFAIVLWNDEVHSFQDVIDQCTEALLCSQMEGKRIAETVDMRGRDVLRVGTSIPDLMDIATAMTNVSLCVSIRAARDVFREQLSASLLIWLRDLTCCKFRPLARVFQGKINNAIRVVISHQLCLRWVAPYRNATLANILASQYSYYLPDSESEEEEDEEDDEDNDDDVDDVGVDEDDDDDDDEIDVDDDEEDDEGGMDEDDPDEYDDALDSHGGVHGSDSLMRVDTEHDGMRGQLSSLDSYAWGMPAGSAQPIPAGSEANGPAGSSHESYTQMRGQRRRRSDSEDSLRNEGEERGSPRGYSQSAGRRGRGLATDMWANEHATNTLGDSLSSAGLPAMGSAPHALPGYVPPRGGDDSGGHALAGSAKGAHAQQAADQARSQTVALRGSEAADDYDTELAINKVLRGCGQQRLDWFLIFDLQLWKEVRSGLRELYMATLMLDSRYKMKIALTFARNYPRLSRAFLMQDRAPEHSVLLFSVQLFTAPTLSASLVDHHCFMYIILDVLKRFFVQPTPVALQACGVILCDTESFRNRRYFHVFHDMRYLAGTPQVRNWVSSHHQFLSTYVGFIGLFQGMNPNRRAVHEHVEFEADTWVNAFNVTLQLAKSCRQFAECYGISARDLYFAMRGTLRKLQHSVQLMAEENYALIIRSMHALGHTIPNMASNIGSGDTGDVVRQHFGMHTLGTLWGRTYEVVRYDVSASPISFHHPLHWFMAELCQHVKHLTDERAQDFGFATVRDMVFSAFDRRFDLALEAQGLAQHLPALHAVNAQDELYAQRELLRILDYPVRVCVVMAQIRAGLWVRNGYVIRSQSHHYREVSLRENTYDQDIVLIQFFASIWRDPDHILMTLLDRFGLYDWLSGRPHEPSVYEPAHMHYMVEEFLNLLIVLVSERHVAMGKNILDLARREIVHGCLSPISYSELSKKVPERLAEHTEFDNLLQQLANYRGPVSVLDHGLYELKDEFLDEVDPFFIHYSRNQREEVEELLRERLRKRVRKNGGEPEDVPAYLPPKLEEIRFGPFQRIGMLLHTPLACQVLFYSLFNATNTQAELLSETMVDEALQLIVLALEDGRRGSLAREIGERDSEGTTDRGGLWKYALEQGYPSGRGAPLNLLGLVLTLGLKPEMKQWKPKLNYIQQLFREGGPRIVNCIEEYFTNLEATPMGSRVLRSAMEESKAAERKKRAAQARQRAILAEMATQQKSFMAQLGAEYDDLSDDDTHSGRNAPASAAAASPAADSKGKGADTSRTHAPLWAAPAGGCIVCQEDCDGAKPYGVLSLVQASRAVRTAPLSEATHVIDILRLPGELDAAISDFNAVPSASPEGGSGPAMGLPPKAVSSAAQAARGAEQMSAMNQVAAGSYGAPSGLKGFPVLYHERGMAASTCGHLMHMRCFMQYCQGIESKRQQQPTRNHPENPHRKEFLCPLCKSLGNVLLPALPYTANYDPLVIADHNLARFERPAAETSSESALAFEQWLCDDWLPFAETLTTAGSGKIGDQAASAGSASGDIAGNSPHSHANANATANANPNASANPSTGAGSNAVPAGESAMGGLVSALRNTGSFNLFDSVADTVPRLEALLRNAQRIPAGLNFQALLSRFLPHLGSGSLRLSSSAERLALPLSQYVTWLVDRQAYEYSQHHAHNQARKNGRTMGADAHAQTPDASGASMNAMGFLPPPPGGMMPGDRSSGEFEARAREQMETYQFMYTRLYDVLQSVQRDNYVGLPPLSLFKHITRPKDKSVSGAGVPYHHSQHGLGADHLHDGRELGDEGEYEEGEDDEEGEEDEDDDDDDDEYMYRSAAMGGVHGAASVYNNEQPPVAALPQFLHSIVDHLRTLSAGGGSGLGVFAHLQATVKSRTYPFDRAISSLFAHSIEMLELSQRGTRNPPVFDHEDSRTLPSGTLSDAIPESHAVFMHSLGKIPEMHYRTVFGTPAAISRTNALDLGDGGVCNKTPAQRLHALFLDVQMAMSSSSASGMQGDSLSYLRLEMLRDLAYSMASLNGVQTTAHSRDLQSEQSLWTTGVEGMPVRPFLMQDNFALLTEISLSLVIPFGLDIWQLVRLFVVAELVRACIAVGDSLLGEYTGAPKALRIAQHLPIDPASRSHGPAGGASAASSARRSAMASTNATASNAAAAATTPAAAAAATATAAGSATATAASNVPQPWVDAPESRDPKLLSLLSDGSDASLLKESAPGIHSLVLWAIRLLQGPEVNEDALKRLEGAAHPVTVTKLVTTLMLPFLRRVALLFYIQYGVDIASEAPWLVAERQRAMSDEKAESQVLSQSEPECTRLLKLLHLPNLDQILDIQTQPRTVSLVETWVGNLRAFRQQHSSAVSLGAGYTMAIPVDMPTLYSLVELPDGFEGLFERSAKAFCSRCGGVPNDPALCLLCGSFVCAQSFCCEEDGIGECNMHMKTCGGTVGVYLLVKKCGLLLLHHDNGCFMSAPYLDQHGEVDLGLKRGRPLYINRTRYEEMRKLVLTQKIPVFIARKIDQTFDIGGWVSL